MKIFYQSQAGFTLLELLLALGIFALMGAFAYRGLSTVLESQQLGEQHAQRLSTLQFAFSRMQKDLRQALARPTRDQWGSPQAAFFGDGRSLEFSRTGWANPLRQKRSELQRVRYFLQDKRLIRAYLPMLDNAPDAQALQTVLLEELKNLQIRYLDDANQWHQRWPPLTASEHHLRAVEVILETVQWGEIKRLFAILQMWPESQVDAGKEPNAEITATEAVN